MRLLHTTDLRFEEFFDSQVPTYAILSHRWLDRQEVSYEEFLQAQKGDEAIKGKGGYQKIKRFAKLAYDKYECEWCWIDT